MSTETELWSVDSTSFNFPQKEPTSKVEPPYPYADDNENCHNLKDFFEFDFSNGGFVKVDYQTPEFDVVYYTREGSGTSGDPYVYTAVGHLTEFEQGIEYYYIIHNPEETYESKYDYYTPGDICEKPPFKASDLTTFDGIIYPLGGNLRSYSLSSFLSSFEDVSATLLNIKYSENSNFDFKIGSHWEGSFSVDSTPRNGNLIDAENRFDGFKIIKKLNNGSYEDFSPNEDFSCEENMFSVLHVHDRIHFSKKVSGSFDAHIEYDKEFSGLSEGIYWFTFYVKGNKKNGVPIYLESVDDITSENGNLGKEYEILDYYQRFGIKFTIEGSSTSKIIQFKFNKMDGDTPHNTELYDLDICGICLSKGNFPIEIDYREDAENHPLVFNIFNNSDQSWTIKYKRYVFGNNGDSNSYYDSIHGIKVEYPQFPGEWENITVIHDLSEGNKIIVSSKSNYRELIPTSLPETIPLPLRDNDKVDVLLGGVATENGNIYTFKATPGIYRDLMHFSRALSDDEIKSIDNSLMGVMFDGNNLPFLKSSFFKESL